MDADDGFVEFVSARWSRLYRTAYLLTSDEAAAEDVLQSAMEKTYALWPKVSRMVEPEAYVRKIMVNAVISARRRLGWIGSGCADVLQERPLPPEDLGVVDHALLWPLVCALPERQRAVVVLRYYEDLTEAPDGRDARLRRRHREVTGARRDTCSAPWARRGAAGGGARRMSLDQELRAVLAERADRCQAPAPDLHALRAGGLRRRRRRHAVVAVATCLLLGTIAARTGPGLGQRDTRGAFDPVDRPKLPWAESDTRAHVRRRRRQDRWRRTAHRSAGRVPLQRAGTGIRTSGTTAAAPSSRRRGTAPTG